MKALSRFMRLPYILGAALAAGGAAFVAAGRKGAISNSVKPSTQFAKVPLAQISEQQKAIYQGAAEVMKRAYGNVLSRSPSDAELTYLLAVAKLETSFGRGWKEPMKASNNWGAVQCGKSVDPSTCIPYEDSYPDGRRYKISFRSYPTPEDGAGDVVKHILVHRPGVEAALKSDNPTIFRASLTMRRTSYYGGFCPKTVSKYGGYGRLIGQRDPQSPSEWSCEREAVEMHAKSVVSKIASEIASALGTEPMALGTYEDALAWYSKERLGLKEAPVVPIAGDRIASAFDAVTLKSNCCRPSIWPNIVQGIQNRDWEV